MSFLVPWWDDHVMRTRSRAGMMKPMSSLQWGSCIQHGSAHPLDPSYPWMRWDRTARSIEEAWSK